MNTSKLMVLLILLVATTACGREPGSYVGFEGHVNAFVAEGKARGVTVDTYGLDIKLVDALDKNSEPGSVALCNIDNGRVTVLKKYWDENPLEQEELVFHEMGHCVLMKDHSSCPNIMCPNIIGFDVYQPNRKHFLDELFKP